MNEKRQHMRRVCVAFFCMRLVEIFELMPADIF